MAYESEVVHRLLGFYARSLGMGDVSDGSRSRAATDLYTEAFQRLIKSARSRAEQEMRARLLYRAGQQIATHPEYRALYEELCEILTPTGEEFLAETEEMQKAELAKLPPDIRRLLVDGE